MLTRHLDIRTSKRSGGWAAGLTVLIEHTSKREAAPDAAAPPALFEYFASEIFARAPVELRDLWLRTAYLPRITEAMARPLTGSTAAGKLPDDLCRRQYFTYRRHASETQYQYHALFRDFLRQHAELVYSHVERQQLAHSSARALEEHRDHETAFALYREAGD